MSKKILAYGDNQSVEVETDGNLWGFRSGDTITRDKDFENFFYWKNKKVCVEGFRDIELWGKVEGEKISRYTSNPKGLILLERPGLEFKVGDEVVIAKSICKRIEGEEGIVIVICPYQYAGVPYLVEFNKYKRYDDKEPWYPIQYGIDLNRERWWQAENHLEFLSENI